jgi:hypothetical protein
MLCVKSGTIHSMNRKGMCVWLLIGIDQLQKNGSIETKKKTAPVIDAFLRPAYSRSSFSGLFLSAKIELAKSAWIANNPPMSEA